MIRLTHLITSMSRGGAQSMVVKIVNELAKKGNYKQDLIVLSGRSDYTHNSNITIHYLNISKNKSLISSLLKFRSIIKILKPDVLQAWMYHANFLAYFSGVPKKNIIFNIRHSLDDINNEKRLTRWMIIAGSYMSKFVHSTIYCSVKSMSQHRGANYCSRNSVYIPNGFNHKKFSPNQEFRNKNRNKLSIPNDAFVIGCIARFHPMKNQIGLIREFAQLDNKNCILLLIGEGVTRNKIDSLNKELKITDRVILLEKQKYIEKWLPVLDSLVIPSLWGEAFPNILGEAMATQIPCIVSNVGDSSEIIGSHGIIIENSIISNSKIINSRIINQVINDVGKLIKNLIYILHI